MNERTMIPPVERLRENSLQPRLTEGRSRDPGAVSWSAVMAGAAAAAALSLILLVLGVGLGVSSISPWSGQGLSAQTFGVSTILWITFAQLAASGMGGYLAGRLRHRWLETDMDETYFRDTAHGFLAWAVASLVTAAVLGSAVGSIVAGGAQAGAAMVPAAAGVVGAAGATAASDMNKGADSRMGSGYFVDTLFRKPAGSTDTGAPAPATANATGDSGAAPSTAEATRIFANAAHDGTLSPDDTKYLGQMIAQRTGMPQADAEKRATDSFNRMQAAARQAETTAREAADKTRKATAYTSLWLFVSLLAGAFVASLSATRGGRRRDLY
jgi:hypothetical protein